MGQKKCEFFTEHVERKLFFVHVFPDSFFSVSLAPCAPVGVDATVGCKSGTVSVWWDESVGAVSYTATLERSDGNTSCCTAHNTTYCEVTSLPCGQMYVLTVTAEGRTCNSSQSTAAIIRTGTLLFLVS